MYHRMLLNDYMKSILSILRPYVSHFNNFILGSFEDGLPPLQQV